MLTIELANFREAISGKMIPNKIRHLRGQFERHLILFKEEYKPGLIKNEETLGKALAIKREKYLNSQKTHLEKELKVENSKNILSALLSAEDQAELEINYASTRTMKNQHYWQSSHDEEGIKQLIGFMGQPIYACQKIASLTNHFGLIHSSSILASLFIDYKYSFIPAPTLDLIFAEKEALAKELRSKNYLTVNVIEKTRADVEQEIAEGLIQLSKAQPTPELAGNIITQNLQTGLNYQFSETPPDITYENRAFSEVFLEKIVENDDAAIANIIKDTLHQTTTSLSISAYGKVEMPAIPGLPPPPKQKGGFFRVLYRVIVSAANEYFRDVQIRVDGSGVSLRQANAIYPIYNFNSRPPSVPNWNERAPSPYAHFSEKMPTPDHFSPMTPTFTSLFQTPETSTTVIPFLPTSAVTPQITGGDPLALAIQGRYEPVLDPNLYSSFLGNNQPPIYRIPAGLTPSTGSNSRNIISDRFEAFPSLAERNDLNTIFQPTEPTSPVVPFSPINPNFSPMAPGLGTTLGNSALPIAMPHNAPLPLTSQIPPNMALQPSTYEPVLDPNLYSSFMSETPQPLIFSQPMGLISPNAINSKGILSNTPAKPREPAINPPVTKNAEPKKPVVNPPEKSAIPQKMDAKAWLEEFGGTVPTPDLIGSDADLLERLKTLAPEIGNSKEESDVIELVRDEKTHKRSDGSNFQYLFTAEEASIEEKTTTNENDIFTSLMEHLPDYGPEGKFGVNLSLGLFDSIIPGFSKAMEVAMSDPAFETICRNFSRAASKPVGNALMGIFDLLIHPIDTVTGYGTQLAELGPQLAELGPVLGSLLMEGQQGLNLDRLDEESLYELIDNNRTKGQIVDALGMVLNDYWNSAPPEEIVGEIVGTIGTFYLLPMAITKTFSMSFAAAKTAASFSKAYEIALNAMAPTFKSITTTEKIAAEVFEAAGFDSMAGLGVKTTNTGPAILFSAPVITSRSTIELPDYVYHSVRSPHAIDRNSLQSLNFVQSILDGIDITVLRETSRFGKGLYSSEFPVTTLYELNNYGTQPTHTIRLLLKKESIMVLDLTNPQIAMEWGYYGGKIRNEYRLIGQEAAIKGYNTIKVFSERGPGPNFVIIKDFDKVLQPEMVVESPKLSEIAMQIAKENKTVLKYK